MIPQFIGILHALIESGIVVDTDLTVKVPGSLFKESCQLKGFGANEIEPESPVSQVSGPASGEASGQVC